MESNPTTVKPSNTDAIVLELERPLTDDLDNESNDTIDFPHNNPLPREHTRRAVNAASLPKDSISNTSRWSSFGNKVRQSSVTRFFRELIPYGGVISNCFTFGSVTLGGGIISMPSAFLDSGIIMGVIYLVVLDLMTIYTLALMALVMQKTGLRTYEEMARLLFGRGWDYFVGFILWLSCVGTAIAYISAVSSLVDPILQNSPGTPDFLKTPNGNRLVTSMVWLVFMVPLVIPKRVNSLRYVTALGCTMLVYFSFCVVAHSSTNGLRLGMRENMQYFRSGNKAIYGLSIFVFSFLSHAVTYSVYFEMRPKPSVKWLTVSCAISMTVCTILYILVGMFGYFDFADATNDSILYNYDPVHTPYMMVAYMGLLIQLCAAYAMNMIPIRNFMYHCISWNLDTLPYWKHILTILCTSAVILVSGLFIPSINLAFGMVGSLCGGFIAFLFPAYFWMYAGKWSLRSVGVIHWLCVYSLLPCGVVAIVWGTIATIYRNV